MLASARSPLPVAGVQLGELRADRRPRILDLRGSLGALKRGIDAFGRADERLTSQCSAFDVAGNADELLIQRRVIGERREPEPQLQIALCVCAARIEATGR